LFHYDAEQALADPRVRDEMREEAPQRVIRGLATALATASRLDRERFRRGSLPFAARENVCERRRR